MLKGKFTPLSLWEQKGVLLVLSLAFLTLCISLAISKWGEKAFIISLALIVGVTLISVSFMHERFPLYLLVIALPFSELLKVDYIPSTLLVIPGSLAVISLLAAIAFRKKKLFFQSPALIFAVLLGIWATIATFSVENISNSRPYWLVIILFWLIPNLVTQKEYLLRIGWLFLLPLGIMGLYIFIFQAISFLSTRSISAESLHLVRFGTGDKNIVGLWLTLAIPFAYYLYGYYKNEPVKRFLLLVNGGAMLAGALATLSLGVVVGLCAMIVTIIWLQPNVAARLRFLVLGIILVPLIFNGLIIERLHDQQLLTIDEAWGSNRGALWVAGARTILDHPIFGIGLDPAGRIAMLKYVNLWYVQQWYELGILVEPHNFFLSVGLDIGLPGLILYLLLLVFLFFSLLSVRRKLKYSHGSPEIQVITNSLLVALMVGWVQSMALSVHLDKLMWFLMAFAVALIHITNDEQGINDSQIDKPYARDVASAAP